MADENQVKALMQSIEKILEYQDKSLVSRPEWGSISFAKAEKDFDRIFSVLGYLKVLPLEYLTDTSVKDIGDKISQLEEPFKNINAFNIEAGGTPQSRDGFVTAIHRGADNFFASSAPWLPFLAYQKGDVTKNIDALSASVQEARTMVDAAKKGIEAKVAEINDIIVKAKEASASAGAAVFTHDFKKEAEERAGQARPWLYATGAFGTATVLLAILTWFWTQGGLDAGQIIQKVASKVVALSVLVTGTLWCGKIYKALMHQSTVNKHRALSLQTFQAFSAAASDNQTKDAVLMETTRAIFANTATGYISPEAESNETESRIIEIAKSVIPSAK